MFKKIMCLSIIVVLMASLGAVSAFRPAFDVIRHHNSTMYFNLTDLGYTQDTIDLVNRSVMDCFQYWGQPGYALLGTGREVRNIVNNIKLGDAILWAEVPSVSANYSIYSVTNNSNFGYRNETSFAASWNNIFGSMLNYFNSTVKNATDWTFYMTFLEGYVSMVPGNDNGTIIKTHNNVSAYDIKLGDKLNISSKLYLGGNEPVANKTIIFNVNGQESNVTTDENGMAILEYVPTVVGPVNVSTKFFTDEHYLGSNSNTSFNVVNGIMDTNLNISKSVNATNVFVDDLVKYTINVENLGNNSVDSVKVNDILSDSLEFVNSDSNNTGSSGMPYLWNIPSLKAGDNATLNIICKVKKPGIIKNTASLVIPKYNNTLANNSSVDINATTPYNPLKPTHISLIADNINFGGIVHIIANLTDNDSMPLVNQTINLNVGNFGFGKKLQTDENGIVKWDIPNLPTAMYTVTALFNETLNYSSSSNFTQFFVFSGIGPVPDNNTNNSTVVPVPDPNPNPDGNDTNGSIVPVPDGNDTNGSIVPVPDGNDTNGSVGPIISDGNGVLNPIGPDYGLGSLGGLSRTAIPLLGLLSLLVLAGGIVFKRK